MFHSLIMAVAIANGPVLIARGSPRCNNVIATQLGDQLRGFEKHPAKPEDWDKRFAALKDLLSQADIEQGVLTSVCPENDLVPVASQLEATRAWAIMQESDIARDEYAQDCPAQGKPVTAGFLAEAWLHAIKATPDGTKPAKLTTEVQSMIQTRAETVELKLPPPADTSNYWMTGIQSQGRTAAKACPTPSP